MFNTAHCVSILPQAEDACDDEPSCEGVLAALHASGVHEFTLRCGAPSSAVKTRDASEVREQAAPAAAAAKEKRERERESFFRASALTQQACVDGPTSGFNSDTCAQIAGHCDDPHHGPTLKKNCPKTCNQCSKAGAGVQSSSNAAAAEKQQEEKPAPAAAKKKAAAAKARLKAKAAAAEKKAAAAKEAAAKAAAEEKVAAAKEAAAKEEKSEDTMLGDHGTTVPSLTASQIKAGRAAAQGLRESLEQYYKGATGGGLGC